MAGLMRQLLLCAVLVLLIGIGRLALRCDAQSSYREFVYGLCNTAKFSANSTFARNYNTTMGVLLAQSSTSRYGTANATADNDSVYAMFQCRGDLPLSQCQPCVSIIINSYASSCHSAIGMRMMLRGCFLRYEPTSDFLTAAEIRLVENATCSATLNRNSVYQANLARALNLTARSAPANGGFNASSQATTDSNMTAYALCQCMGYLNRSECASCLAQVSKYKVMCNDSVAGEVQYVSCYYLFGNSPLLFASSPGAAGEGLPIAPSPAPVITAAPQTAAPVGNSAVANNGTTAGKPGTSSKLRMVVGSTVGALALVLALLAAALFLKQRRRTAVVKESKAPLNKHYWIDDSSVVASSLLGRQKSFSLQELREATDNFDIQNKLGEGGFGPVYKGRLVKMGREVAIKMLSTASNQGEAQFRSEVTLISSVQHRNLVELLGCCVEEGQHLLVYEYLPNRSLDLLLFGEVGIVAPPVDNLKWNTRFNIIMGIASGLRYLHEESAVKIVHRDIKASNILLDSTLTPKIADFGLARFFCDDITHITTRVAGTPGYLAPEYAINGQLTEKADVYSFGLLALEVISGRRIIDKRLKPEKQHLLAWTWALFETKQQVAILDPRLQEDKTVIADEVIRMVHVALLCAQPYPDMRPAMSQVDSLLCGESNILHTPTKPTIIQFEGATQGLWSSSTTTSV